MHHMFTQPDVKEEKKVKQKLSSISERKKPSRVQAVNKTESVHYLTTLPGRKPPSSFYVVLVRFCGLYYMEGYI